MKKEKQRDRQRKRDKERERTDEKMKSSIENFFLVNVKKIPSSYFH